MVTHFFVCRSRPVLKLITALAQKMGMVSTVLAVSTRPDLNQTVGNVVGGVRRSQKDIPTFSQAMQLIVFTAAAV